MKTCCICESPFEGFGNNPEPFAGEIGTCCDHCNNHWVVPVRLIFGRDGARAPLELFTRIAGMGASFERTQKMAFEMWEAKQKAGEHIKL